MAKLGTKIRTLEGGRIAFHCPGCDTRHAIVVDGSRGWRFNGDGDRPTISPSILVRVGGRGETDEELRKWGLVRVCHSFVQHGRIKFLDDCTHGLAGQTVDLPDL